MAFKSMTYERLARTRQVVALVLAAAVLTGVQPEALADESAAKDTHTVLVTGANRGLGLEFARQYKEAGSRVIGTARNPDEAEELAALDVRVMQLDVTNQESVDNLVAALDGEAIDVLINNAGIFPRVGKIDEIDFDDYNRTLAVNTVGPVRVTRALLPNLRRGELKIIAGLSSNLRLSREQSSPQHVHEDPCRGTWARRLHLRRADAWLGADGHGRPERHADARRVDFRYEGGARQADAGG
jgi:NAD(P)-dependent dehydrogenase (short-subunit alcohol dehydrogenase family)